MFTYQTTFKNATEYNVHLNALHKTDVNKQRLQHIRQKLLTQDSRNPNFFFRNQNPRNSEDSSGHSPIS